MYLNNTQLDPTESNFDLTIAVSDSNESPNQTLHDAAHVLLNLYLKSWRKRGLNVQIGSEANLLEQHAT